MKSHYYCQVSFLVLIGMLMLSAALVYGAEESIVVTTYYPSPYGVYGEMRLYPKAYATCNSQQEGLMYYDNDPPSERGLRICVCKNPPCPPGGFDWMSATSYWAASPLNFDNIYNTNSGNVGIGTNDPASEKLQVVGNVYSTNFYKSGNLTAVNNALSLLNATQVGFGAGFTGNDFIGIGKNTAGDIGLSIVKNGVIAGSFSYDEAGGALNNIRVEGDGTTPVALATQDADIYVAAGKRGNFYVQTDPTGSSPKNRMFIRGSDGNVGIGTTNPTTPAPNGQGGNLDVNDVYLRSTGKWASVGSGGQLKFTSGTIAHGIGPDPGCGSWTDTYSVGFTVLGAFIASATDNWTGNWHESRGCSASWSGTTVTFNTHINGGACDAEQWNWFAIGY